MLICNEFWTALGSIATTVMVALALYNMHITKLQIYDNYLLQLINIFKENRNALSIIHDGEMVFGCEAVKNAIQQFYNSKNYDENMLPTYNSNLYMVNKDIKNITPYYDSILYLIERAEKFNRNKYYFRTIMNILTEEERLWFQLLLKYGSDNMYSDYGLLRKKLTLLGLKA